LQAQITESEKLASIGQLVGGAAHELNNPITAMLGYSDLLLSTPLTPEQTELARRVGQHARRTRALVASLLSFAKQGPAAMSAVDLNTLLRTAVKLSQPQWEGLQIEVRTELPQELLVVRGDSNQLLQMCVQVINDALHAAGEDSCRTLTIAAERNESLAIINVFDASFGSMPSQEKFENAAEGDGGQAPSGLGLSACQNIVQQHQGRILWRQDKKLGITIRVELPVIPPASEKSTGAGIPVMWQTQPFA
jgi:C4-dicarboxylate-specific signal transduction histidine kinase